MAVAKERKGRSLLRGKRQKQQIFQTVVAIAALWSVTHYGTFLESPKVVTITFLIPENVT